MEYLRLRYQSTNGFKIVPLLGTGNKKGYPTISIRKSNKVTQWIASDCSNNLDLSSNS
jgi:hypothetical protein